nr:MAG TPA: internal head protein [Caudoviricetes sp.]
MRRFLAKENETVVLSEDELAANEAKTSIILNEVEELSHEIDRASDIAEALENMQVIMSDGEEPTARELALINVANQMAMAGDENKVTLVPAEEGYYRRHTALEGIGEAIANVWKAIWSMISRLFNAIFSLFGGGSGVGGSVARIEKHLKKVSERRAKLDKMISEGWVAKDKKVKVEGDKAYMVIDKKDKELFDTIEVLDVLFVRPDSAMVKAIDSFFDQEFSVNDENNYEGVAESLTLMALMRVVINEALAELAKQKGITKTTDDSSTITLDLPFNKKLVYTTKGIKSQAFENDDVSNVETVEEDKSGDLEALLEVVKETAEELRKQGNKDPEAAAVAAGLSVAAGKEIPQLKGEAIKLLNFYSTISLSIRNQDKLVKEAYVEIEPLSNIETNLDNTEDFLNTLKHVYSNAAKANFVKDAKNLNDTMTKLASKADSSDSSIYKAMVRLLQKQVTVFSKMAKFVYVDIFQYQNLAIEAVEFNIDTIMNAYSKPE